MRSRMNTLALTGFAVLVAVTCAWAQQQPARLAGTIEGVDGATLTIKTEQGSTKVKLVDNARILTVDKVTMTDLKKSDFVGVGAMPQADGSQRAVQVSIFPESQRGQGERHGPWSSNPNGTMTNGTIDTTVVSVDGQVLMVKYKDGEKKIIVPPEALVLRYTDSDRAALKPGAQVALNPLKQPDGTIETLRVNIGRGGYAPQ